MAPLSVWERHAFRYMACHSFGRLRAVAGRLGLRVGLGVSYVLLAVGRS